MKAVNKIIAELKTIACELNAIEEMSIIKFVITYKGEVLLKYEPRYDYCGKAEYWLNPVTYNYPELGGCTYTIKFRR